MNRKNILIILGLLAFIVIIGGISYSYFIYNKDLGDVSITTGEISINYSSDNGNMTLTGIVPKSDNEGKISSDYIDFTVDGVVDTDKIYYELSIIEDSGNTLDTQYIKLYLTDQEDHVIKGVTEYDDLPSNEKETGKRFYRDTIDPNQNGTKLTYSKDFRLRIWLDVNYNEPSTKIFDFNVNLYAKNVDDDYVIPEGLRIITKNVDTNTTINFANASSSSNGEGLYILPGTENDTNPIYYYRGAITNNNVLFAGFCWQIVRTTETGGIKMIYNGLPDIEGSGDNITYNCGTTRDIQDTIRTTTSLSQSTGYYYADDYEIVSTSGNSVIYRLKSKTNPITQVAIADATAAASNIPTIATNYPYTCKQTTDSATCTTLYKVDSYASGTNAYVYSSLDRPIIGRSEFHTQYSSVSDVGYMSNTRYAYQSSAPGSGAYFGTNIEYGDFDSNGTDEYRLLDDGNGSVGTTLDSSHHYSCNATTATGTCTTLRYYYYKSGTTYRYINLTSGDTIEDALYKMTGNGSAETKTKNSAYNLNVNNSTAKTAIDAWYSTNLSSYSTYLEDTVFCNDRSYKTEGSSKKYTQSGWNPNGGYLITDLYFGTHNRYNNSWYSTTNVPAVKNTGEIPNIACPNETDRFTVSNTNGNGALTYPVGLLTADEIILAGVGGNNSDTTTYYLYTNDYYWSLAPYSIDLYTAYEFHADTSILRNDFVYSNTRGLRPVVSLRLGTEFESGGDGSPTNPYIVKYE